jgi:hypothetical protein
MLTSHFCARAESYMTQVCEVAHMRPHMYPICPQRNVSIERALHQAMPSASDWISLEMPSGNEPSDDHQDPSGNASFGRKR